MDTVSCSNFHFISKCIFNVNFYTEISSCTEAALEIGFIVLREAVKLYTPLYFVSRISSIFKAENLKFYSNLIPKLFENTLNCLIISC